MTYTYAILKVSQAVFDEIKTKLEVAEYDHAFHEDDEGLLIDMHGIALQAEKSRAPHANV